MVTAVILLALGISILNWGAICELKDDIVEKSKAHLMTISSLHRRLKELEEANASIPIFGHGQKDETTASTHQEEVETNEAATAFEEKATISQDEETQEITTQETTAETSLHQSETTEREETTRYQEAVTTALEIETDPQVNFCVGVYQDVIGVFDRKGQLVEVCNVYIMTLPIADRNALKEGIYVASYDEVQNILNGYK